MNEINQMTNEEIKGYIQQYRTAQMVILAQTKAQKKQIANSGSARQTRITIARMMTVLAKRLRG
jgi:ribosomal protein L29